MEMQNGRLGDTATLTPLAAIFRGHANASHWKRKAKKIEENKRRAISSRFFFLSHDESSYVWLP